MSVDSTPSLYSVTRLFHSVTATLHSVTRRCDGVECDGVAFL